MPKLCLLLAGKKKSPDKEGSAVKEAASSAAGISFSACCLFFCESSGRTTPRMNYSSQRDRTFCDIVYPTS